MDQNFSVEFGKNVFYEIEGGRKTIRGIILDEFRNGAI